MQFFKEPVTLFNQRCSSKCNQDIGFILWDLWDSLDFLDNGY